MNQTSNAGMASDARAPIGGRQGAFAPERVTALGVVAADRSGARSSDVQQIVVGRAGLPVSARARAPGVTRRWPAEFGAGGAQAWRGRLITSLNFFASGLTNTALPARLGRRSDSGEADWISAARLEPPQSYAIWVPAVAGMSGGIEPPRSPP